MRPPGRVRPGLRVGHLVVLRFSRRVKHNLKWWCLCEPCGKEHEAWQSGLSSGMTKSCGCSIKRAKSNLSHGLSKTSIYARWEGLKRNHKDTIHRRWLKFENFYADVGDARPGFAIMKKNVNRPLGPNNFQWVHRSDFNRHTKDAVRLSYKGKTQHVIEWAHELGVPVHALVGRLNRGWSVKKTLTEPLKTKPMPWSEQDVDLLKKKYPYYGGQGCLKFFPGRNRDAIACKAQSLKLLCKPRQSRRCHDCDAPLRGTPLHCGNYCVEHHAAREHVRLAQTPRPYRRVLGNAFTSARRRARVTGLPFDLTLDDVLAMWKRQNGRCAYSSLPLELGTFRDSARTPLSPSLDRKIPALGYTKKNTVLCSWGVNAGKQDFTLDQYLQVCRAVVSQHGLS